MAYKEATLKDTSPQHNIKDKVFSGLGSLIKLLPTGTVFMFQFLNPILTNNGDCDDSMNKHLSRALIGGCGLACFFSSFTDSYVDLDGSVHYGIATPTGLWPSEDDSVDLSKYKLRLMDFVHALLSLTVFLVVSLLDYNTVECLYPKYAKEGKHMLKVLPPMVGAVSSLVFTMFPSKRHGIGYPFDNNSDYK